jgi:hypothetical protein
VTGILARGNETFLLINGLKVSKAIQLSESTTLEPVRKRPRLESITIIEGDEIDRSIVSIYLEYVQAQLHITGPNAKTLARSAWNAQWDVVLLSAIFNCRADCILQSTTSALVLGPTTMVNVLHRHLADLGSLRVFRLTARDEKWLQWYFAPARELMREPNFQNAVHSMSSYHWHPHPRAKLAILWSGIEGLFSIESELAFRMSLYCARFLAPSDLDELRAIFAMVKKLYRIRSQAVHGARLGEDINVAVADSSELLRRLIRRCIEVDSLPQTEDLVP